MRVPTAADPERLRSHVRALEGVRHRLAAPEALGAAERYVADTLAALDLGVARQPFEFAGAVHHNVIGTRRGARPDRPRVLVGAHFDTVPGTPGADDNASGVAALLEIARLTVGAALDATVEYVAFNLEEPQGQTYRVGSRAFAAQARRRGDRYVGALVLEMVGFTTRRSHAQGVPFVLFWKRIPKTATFLAALADGQSRRLLAKFARLARRAVPELELVTLRTPLRGWLVPQTRLSDNASFWDRGYPALMLTDTAFLRNPHYHGPGDRLETLDFGFLSRVADAAAAAVQALAGEGSAGD